MAVVFDEIMVTMKAKTTINNRQHHQHRCEFCGRYFKPHPSQGQKQRACGRPECKALRKKTSQKRWCKNNPGYFKGRYSYVKDWRKSHPDHQKNRRTRMAREIQDTLPYNSSIITLHLAVMDKRLHIEIQDALRCERACGRGLVVCGREREIQDTLAF